ncbi:MAG: PAS domain-containing protein [Alphaproteobacteria bacterium]|nr:PAS domain-containing protein [Alphaproteobacteria bacterium]
METPTAAITDDRVREAYDYWRRIAAGRAMPRRADLDPLDIPKLLPHVMIAEVHGPGRYRYRLIGTANAQEHGTNATGKFVDEAIAGPEYRAHVIGLYDECAGQRRPVYSESLFLSQAGGAVERHTKVGLMPLSEDGVTVNQVFVIQVFLYIDQKTRDQHFTVARPFKQIVRVRL